MRWTAMILAAMLLAMTMGMVGCRGLLEPTVKGPVSGNEVSLEEARREVDAQAREAEAEIERIKASQEESDAEFAREVRRLQATHEIELDELSAMYERAVGERTRAIAVVTKRHEDLVARTKSAIEAAERQHAQTMGMIEMGAQVMQASGVPVLATIGGGIVGVMGLLGAYRKQGQLTKARDEVRHVADAAYDEAFTKGLEAGRAEHRAADKAWDEAGSSTTNNAIVALLGQLAASRPAPEAKG